MALCRPLIGLAALLLGVSACSVGHYSNRIPGSYGTSFRSGAEASKNRDYEEAAVHYAFAAKSGHPRAQYTYARLLANGRGVERDPVLAGKILEDAYGKSSNYKGRIAYSLGRLLLDGGDGPSGTLEPDPARARVLLTEALESGQPRAALMLGKIYDEGLGTEPDIEKAIGYYDRVDADDAIAARELAMLLVETGAPKERIAEATGHAVNQLERQAEQGRDRAWIMLADIFMRDEIIAPDPERAIGYLENVADEGDPDVLTRLASLYGDIGDPVQEREMLRQAADKGDVRAQTQIAKLFLKAGTRETNGPVGRYYAERAIGQGSEAAMVYLGIALIRGDVLEQDLGSGETLLRRASEAGYSSGTTALGLALIRDEIRPRFPDEGRTLLEEAASRGSTSAMSALGFAYQSGRGLPKDEAAARLWLQRAADAGHPKALRYLEEQEGA
jgi:TPR repeat protein